MKKLAFMLAMTLIFLIGISTVLNHNISATDKKPQISLWIPVDSNGNVVFDQIRSDPKQELTDPKPLSNYSSIHPPKCITVQRVEINSWCFWVSQGGTLKEVCYK